MKIKNIYNLLQSRKKKLFIRTLLFTCLLLSINTFAWFIFIDKFDGNVSANVISWDVTFFDEENEEDQIYLVISDLVPGMSDYEKQIKVGNNGEVAAKFSYEIVSYELLGVEYRVPDNLTNEEAIEHLNSYYPFSISFNNSKEHLNTNGDKLDFNISVKWPFESQNEYFRLNNLFSYSNSFEYYILDNGSYAVDNSVNELNYSSKVLNGLYIESDMADTYWGKLSAAYKKNNPDDYSLKLVINLIVTQDS